MNYLELYQIDIIDGIKVQCLPMYDADAEKWEDLNGGCCEFYGCEFYEKSPCYFGVLCLSDEREDKTSVYFKKVEN
jgi:hypothetical protein